MSGSSAGGKKGAAKILARDPDFYKRIGAKGGKKGTICGIIPSGGSSMFINDHAPYQVTSNGLIIGTNGKPKKPQKDAKGYLRVQIYDKRESNNIKTLKVHRVVAEHFIPNPKNLPQVDHIDGDKTNNDVSNLEWVTNSENSRRAVNRGVFLARKPDEIDLYAAKALGAIEDGYFIGDVLDSFGMNSTTFWSWVEKDNIKPSEYEVNKSWRKKKYYYFDKSRNKWRVERSDYIRVGKQFATEAEAKRYAEESLSGGGFASLKRDADGLNGADRAVVYGSKGGKISSRSRNKKSIDERRSLYEFEDHVVKSLIPEKRNPITSILRRFV